MLEDSEEILYISEMIYPGMCVEDVALNKCLEKGVYKAVLMIRAFKLPHLEEMTGARIRFSFKAV